MPHPPKEVLQWHNVTLLPPLQTTSIIQTIKKDNCEENVNLFFWTNGQCVLLHMNGMIACCICISVYFILFLFHIFPSTRLSGKLNFDISGVGIGPYLLYAYSWSKFPCSYWKKTNSLWLHVFFKVGINGKIVSI